jgi:hypothetical protein
VTGGEREERRRRKEEGGSREKREIEKRGGWRVREGRRGKR